MPANSSTSRPAKLRAQSRIPGKQPVCKCFIECAGGRNRTADTRIFSPLLYRLSYPGLLEMRVRGRSEFCRIQTQTQTMLSKE